jgi:hypothetical protein
VFVWQGHRRLGRPMGRRRPMQSRTPRFVRWAGQTTSTESEASR